MAIINSSLKKSEAGMTLVELSVVVAIVALVSSVIMFNYSRFRGNVTLRGLSQEIALSVRKAQTYATSVQSIDGVGGSTATFPAYGISFSMDTAVASSLSAPAKNQFILFADINDDEIYNAGSGCGSPEDGDECVESFTITSPDRIVQFCTENGCASTGTANIIFRRPAPDARICMVSGGTCESDRPSFITLTLQSANGSQRTVTVWNTGQISVE